LINRLFPIELSEEQELKETCESVHDSKTRGGRAGETQLTFVDDDTIVGGVLKKV